MSEYQCYEFVALDQPLTNQQIQALRAISTRAEITATRFWNEYHWGDLKADPAKLLAQYFDAHLYYANWGSRRLMFRLPAKAVDKTQLQAYFPNNSQVNLSSTAKYLVLDLQSDTDEPDESWYETGGWLAALIPLRADLLRGDLRLAYLAWLYAVQEGDVRNNAKEPPVPANLAQTSASLNSLAEFLRLDPDLLQAAGEASPAEALDAAALRAWVKALPPQDKDRWLLQAVEEPEQALGAQLLRAFQRAQPAGQRPPARTVAQLKARAEELRAIRLRHETERVERERAAAQAARNRHLDKLAKRGEQPWQELERLIDGKNYDQAVILALDLQALAARADAVDVFSGRLAALKKQYPRRRGFFDRMRYAKPPKEDPF